MKSPAFPFFALFLTMSVSRLFYGLFSASLVILVLLLGYGWLAMYRSEARRVQEEVNKLVQNTAGIVQNENFKRYDILKAYTDKDLHEKMAFAAGLTGNQSRIAVTFDDDDSAQKQQLKPRTAVINVSGKKPLVVDLPEKKPGEPKYIPTDLKTIGYYDSLLAKRLLAAGLKVPFKVEKMTHRVDTTTYASAAFIIDFYNPVVYRVVYKLAPTMIINRLMPYTLIAIFLLVLVSAAYILYHKSYRLQLQTSQFRESLLGNATHELKTPIATLQLIMSELQDEATDQVRRKDLIGFAGKELTRTKTLVEKILSFSKLNRRQFDLNKEIINIASLINEAIESVAPAVDAACGTIRFDQQASPEVLGDRVLLLNMMVNLTDNALKYSTGKPCVHITLSSENGFAKISVTDNGIGISPKYHEKIFEPFFRVPTGDKYDIPGHGVGLSFVQQTVKLHNGTISVISAKEQGSTFIINLPAL